MTWTCQITPAIVQVWHDDHAFLSVQCCLPSPHNPARLDPDVVLISMAHRHGQGDQEGARADRIRSLVWRVVVSEPERTNGALTATLSVHEAIPDLLEALVQKRVRVYRIAAQEANLEQVYFALHNEKESVQ